MNQSNISTSLRRFEIDATECHLHIHQRVTPETVIGRDFQSGDTVRAECKGQVVSINFNAANHTLLVLILRMEDS